MIKAIVDQDQVWEQVLIGIELGALNVWSMIILLKTVQTQIQEKSSHNKYNKYLI